MFMQVFSICSNAVCIAKVVKNAESARANNSRKIATHLGASEPSKNDSGFVLGHQYRQTDLFVCFTRLSEPLNRTTLYIKFRENPPTVMIVGILLKRTISFLFFHFVIILIEKNGFTLRKGSRHITQTEHSAKSICCQKFPPFLVAFVTSLFHLVSLVSRLIKRVHFLIQLCSHRSIVKQRQQMSIEYQLVILNVGEKLVIVIGTEEIQYGELPDSSFSMVNNPSFSVKRAPGMRESNTRVRWLKFPRSQLVNVCVLMMDIYNFLAWLPNKASAHLSS